MLSTSTSNYLERINVGVYLLDNFVNVLILSFYFMMFVFDKLKQLQQRPFPCCTLNVIDAHKECFLLLPYYFMLGGLDKSKFWSNSGTRAVG